MSGDERNWVNEAIAMCRQASSEKLTIALVRFQDSNDEADIVLTNAPSPEMLQAIAAVLRAERAEAGSYPEASE